MNVYLERFQSAIFVDLFLSRLFRQAISSFDPNVYRSDLSHTIVHLMVVPEMMDCRPWDYKRITVILGNNLTLCVTILGGCQRKQQNFFYAFGLIE